MEQPESTLLDEAVVIEASLFNSERRATLSPIGSRLGSPANQLEKLESRGRLRKKRNTEFFIVMSKSDQSRCHYDLDLWPARSNGCCKTQAVQASRHVDIGEKDIDLAVFKMDQGFIGISCLKRLMSCLIEEVDEVVTQFRLVFDDKNSVACADTGRCNVLRACDDLCSVI